MQTAVLNYTFKLGEDYHSTGTFEFPASIRYTCYQCHEIMKNATDWCSCTYETEKLNLSTREEISVVHCPVCSQYFMYEEDAIPVWDFMEHLANHLED